jgi:hypothetical protein
MSALPQIIDARPLPAVSTPTPTVPVSAVDLSLAGHPNIAQALAQAREQCKAASKDAHNSHHGYKYASAESILTEATQAFTSTGLHVLLFPPKLQVLGTGNLATYEMVRLVALIHSSGEAVPLGDLHWPVIPDRGRPLDKAFAAAITTSEAYYLRDLLLMPRVDEAGQMDDRDDRAAQPGPTAAERAQQETAAPCIDETQTAELSGLIHATNTDPARLLAHYKITFLQQLPTSKYVEVRDRLKSRLPAQHPAPPTNGSDSAPHNPEYISEAQYQELVNVIKDKHVPVKPLMDFVGVDRFSRMPARWFTWLRLVIAEVPDWKELGKTLKSKTLVDVPADQVERITRHKLMDRIDKWQVACGISNEHMNGRLGQLFNTADITSLTNEQLDKVERRLAEHWQQKGSPVPGAGAGDQKAVPA